MATLIEFYVVQVVHHLNYSYNYLEICWNGMENWAISVISFTLHLSKIRAKSFANVKWELKWVLNLKSHNVIVAHFSLSLSFFTHTLCVSYGY